MAEFIISFEGNGGERKRVECANLDAARNEAVRHLGAYLAVHPQFAAEGHWRVNVENDCGSTLLHVIVATVTARSPAQR